MSKMIFRTVLVAAAMLSMGGSLMATTSPSILGGGVRTIPTAYTIDSTPFVYIYNRVQDSDIQSYEFKIFDSDFKELKSFTVPTPTVVETRYTQWRKYQYREVIPHPYESGETIEIDGQTIDISVDQALEWVKANISSNAEIATLPEGQTVIAWEYWEEKEFGKTYPLRYYYKNDEGVWKMVICEWTGIDYGRYGDWEEAEEQTYTRTEQLPYIETLTFNGGESDWTYLTQTAFSDDSNFNYLLPVLTLTPFSQENEESGYRSWGEKATVSGLKVMSDAGNEVMTFDYPSGYNVEYVSILDMDGKKYVILEAKESGNYQQEYSIIYSLESKSSVVSPLTIQPTTNIAPRAPRHGEPVTVTLSEQASRKGGKVRVVAVNGQTVMSLPVAAGQDTIDIDTGSLQRGVYIVTVNMQDAQEEAAKIIVR